MQLSAGLEEISITDYPAVIASRASQVGMAHVVLGAKWIVVLHILTTAFFSWLYTVYIYIHIIYILWLFQAISAFDQPADLKILLGDDFEP